MKAVEIPTTDPRELLDQIANLVGEIERRQFFDRRPELVDEERVRLLCREVAQEVRGNSERAIELARAARFIAHRLDHLPSRALAARAHANALHFLGDHDRSQELYQEALTLFCALGDDLSAAITRSSALNNLAYIGDYSQVREWEVAARRTFERQGDRLRLAILNHNHANILVRQSRWQEALDSYYAAYEEFENLDRAEDATFCLNNAAACYLDLHRPEKALEIYARSRAYCEAQGLPHLEMVVDYHQAYLYYLRAEYTQSIGLYKTAKRAAESLNDNHQRALCDLGLSEIHLELNLLAEAEELARSAYHGFDRLKMPYEAAKALTNQAITVGRRGEMDLALVMLQRARRSLAQESNPLWSALVDFYRAVVLGQADRWGEAEEVAGRAMAVFDQAGSGSRTVMCQTHLARAQLRLGKKAAALESCNRALARLEALELPALELQAHETLGEVKEALGATDEALDAYARCARWLERMHTRVQGEDLKISYFGSKRSTYESLVYLTHKRAQADADLACLRLIEKAKSRSLADLIAFGAQGLAAKSEPADQLAGQARALREELNWFYRRLDMLAMGEGAVAEPRARRRLQGKVREKEDQLLKIQRRLSARDLELGTMQAATPLELETIRRSIPKRAQLLEYFIARDHIYVAVVDREQARFVPLTAASEARELHRLLQFQLSRGLHSHHSAGILRLIERSTDSHLRELYDRLIDPVRAYLTGDHLVVAPHGFLHYVPFHALKDPGGASMIESFSFSYAPSGGVFHLSVAKRQTFEDRALVMGVADELAPNILDEVRAVAETLPRARLLEGEAADEQALREHGDGCRWLHIATHGIFRRDNPMFSAIQLGTSRLSLFDLYNLRLNTEMVVLSGCGTGLNAVLGADELLGLTRGLLYAGAKSVLVTLWDVHDAATAELMVTFYRYLMAGRPRAKALQAAMLDHQETHPQAYFWAPFVLIGDPGGEEKSS